MGPVWWCNSALMISGQIRELRWGEESPPRAPLRVYEMSGPLLRVTTPGSLLTCPVCVLHVG